MQDLPGKDLGRYHIIDKLGAGGMATVYKAQDTNLKRTVAIKLIRREAFGVEVLERLTLRFEREARVLAQLNHPNIVKVYDYGEFEGAPFLVMGYLQGKTLKEIEKPLTWQKASKILLPIAQALAHVHNNGILHRDVKPSNILIDEAGQPMLADFGIAKLLENSDDATLTGTGIGIGTPEYMAPEQGLGQEVDGRADVYALGIVLYELVTGRKPYAADTPLAVLFKQMNDPLPPPRNFVPNLPEYVEKIIFKALAKKPEDRFNDMNAFAEALERLTNRVAFSPDQPPILKLILPVARQNNADQTMDEILPH